MDDKQLMRLWRKRKEFQEKQTASTTKAYCLASIKAGFVPFEVYPEFGNMMEFFEAVKNNAFRISDEGFQEVNGNVDA